MFAPRLTVAKELLRVCVPGNDCHGQLDATGFVSQMFKTVSKFIAPNGMPRLPCGATIRERLGHGLSELNLTRRQYIATPTPSDVVEFFSSMDQQIGRSHLDADSGERLRRELEALWSAHNRAGTDCTMVLAEYLEVIGVRA